MKNIVVRMCATAKLWRTFEMKFFAQWSPVVAALLLLAGGCQTYPPMPSDFNADSYTLRKHSDADELLKDISMLSLAKAQDIAIANNPNYISAYYAITQAKMRYYQALGAYSPVITSGFTVGETDNWNTRAHNSTAADRGNNFSTNTSVSANWLLFDGLSREFQLKISAAGFDQQKMLTEDDCRLLIRSVAYAYNAVLLAAENMRIAVEDMQFQIKNLHDTELKYQAGAVPLSDVLNFRALANVAEGNQIVAEYQYEVALYALAVLMGYPEGTLPPTVKFPQVTSLFLNDLPGVDIYLDNALANRPDLRAYREQLKIAQYQLYQTYSSYSPTVSAYTEYNYQTNSNRSYNGGSVNTSDVNGNSLSYGLSANWVIFNGFIRYNKVREAKAALESTRYQLANTWLTVVHEVRNAHINYVQNVKQARLYEKTLEITTKQRDLVDDEYKAGNTELTRLNEAQRDLVNAQTTLASAYITVQNAKAQLEAAASMNVSEYGRAPAIFGGEELEVTGMAVPPTVMREVPSIPEIPAPVRPEYQGAEAPATQYDQKNVEKSVNESEKELKSAEKEVDKLVGPEQKPAKPQSWNPDQLTI